MIGRTPDDAKVFGEENDIILVLESRIGICLKNDLKMGSDNLSLNASISIRLIMAHIGPLNLIFT